VNELEQRLQLIRKLGAGGFGEVWMAQDPVRRQQVACKILSTDDANSRIRFRREFSVLQHLDHPGIIKVYDFEQNGRCMYTMDFVEGRNIRDHLASYAWRSEGALDPACNKTKEGLLYTLHLMIQFTDTLSYLHAKSIIHRDLKPENVLFSPKDQHIKILDFGLVRAMGFDEFTSQSGMIQGTPSYIAPEQILGREIDPRADLYALGVILFELITGQVPFRGTTVMALLDAHRRLQPHPPAHGPGLLPAWHGPLPHQLLGNRFLLPPVAQPLLL
jgi:serine/threonine-protein kinase